MSNILDELFRVIEERKSNPSPDSYTSRLYEKGEDEILKKLMEECGEVMIAAKGGKVSQVIYESADLMYHLMVLWAYHGISLAAIWDELERRRR